MALLGVSDYTEVNAIINKKITALLLTILLMAGSNMNVYPGFASSKVGGSEQINVIVGFKADIISSQSTKAAKIESNGGQVRKQFKLINAVSATMRMDEADQLAKDPAVAYVESDNHCTRKDNAANSFHF